MLDWAAVHTGRTGAPIRARWKGNLQHVLRDTAEVKHHEALPYDQVPEFMSRLRARQTVAARALEFCILTAARAGEAMGARWDEINGDTWTLPAERMKEGKAHVVPLSPEVLQIIKDMPRVRVHLRIKGRAQAGRANRARCFQGHAQSAWHQRHGPRFPLDVCRLGGRQYRIPARDSEQALAHTIPNKVEAAYRRGALLDKRRRLMGAWADYCGKSAATGGKVVALRR